MNIFQGFDVDANLLHFVHNLRNKMQNLKSNSVLLYHKPKEDVSKNNRIVNL